MPKHPLAANATPLPDEDPVLAAIQAHSDALTQARDDGAFYRADELLLVVVSTTPATRQGIAAWAEHLERNADFLTDEGRVRTLLLTVRAFAGKLRGGK